MRIFCWKARFRHRYVAGGYLLAENREEAIKKLKCISLDNLSEEIELSDEISEYDGYEINENGVAIKWII